MVQCLEDREGRERYNPVMKVDWRLHRIKRLMWTGRPLAAMDKYDDDYIGTTLRYILRERKWHHEEQCLNYQTVGDDHAKELATLDGTRAAFRAGYAHVREALAFGMSTSSDEPCMLQAQLLTGRDDGQIAAVLRIRPKTIGWYEKIFYNVRWKLEARGWISTAALRVTPEERSRGTAGLWGPFLRWLGYFGGPLALDAALRNAAMIPDVRNGDGDYAKARRNRRLLKIKIDLLFHAWCADPFTSSGADVMRAAAAAMKKRSAAQDEDEVDPLAKAFEEVTKYMSDPEEPAPEASVEVEECEEREQEDERTEYEKAVAADAAAKWHAEYLRRKRRDPFPEPYGEP